MIREGGVGTNNGYGLSSLINFAEGQGASGAQTFYVASEWYNQGACEYFLTISSLTELTVFTDTPNVGGSLNANCYASNVAQWLTGCTGPAQC